VSFKPDNEITRRKRATLAQARRFYRHLSPQWDRAGFEEAALLALVRACREYEPDGGMTLDTYVYTRVRYALMQELRNQHPAGPSRYEALHAGRVECGPQDLAPVSLDVRTRDGLGRPLGELLPDPSGDFAPRVMDELEWGRRWVGVLNAIDALPERQQLVLRRRYLDGLSQHQVARQHGMPQVTVSRTEARAIAALREQLGSLAL
jgi:RNA polymerase sigma factor (sigma-70 family)